jgi:lipopolysaccharide export system protein LptA
MTNHRRRLAQRRQLCAIAIALSATCAHAEVADREKPVNIEADRLSMDDKKKESLFEGNVSMTQGTLLLRADKVTIKQDAEGFNHAVAYGRQVYFRQKREGMDEYIEGYADRMEYDGRGDKVQLFSNALVKKGIDEVRGDYIAYDAVTEFYQVIGGGKSAATPANPQGRVRAVIQPKKGIELTPGKGKPSTPAGGAAGVPAAGKPAPGAPPQ